MIFDIRCSSKRKMKINNSKINGLKVKLSITKHFLIRCLFKKHLSFIWKFLGYVIFVFRNQMWIMAKFWNICNKCNFILFFPTFTQSLDNYHFFKQNNQVTCQNTMLLEKFSVIMRSNLTNKSNQLHWQITFAV